MRNSLKASIARETVACSNMKPKTVFVDLTCSHRPRPSVQKGDKGHAGWGRDPYHVQRSGITTLCGKDCSEWLRIGPREAFDVISDPNLCGRCAAQLKKTL
jgi:hypothetical protein